MKIEVRRGNIVRSVDRLKRVELDKLYYPSTSRQLLIQRFLTVFVIGGGMLLTAIQLPQSTLILGIVFVVLLSISEGICAFRRSQRRIVFENGLVVKGVIVKKIKYHRFNLHSFKVEVTINAEKFYPEQFVREDRFNSLAVGEWVKVLFYPPIRNVCLDYSIVQDFNE